MYMVFIVSYSPLVFSSLPDNLGEDCPVFENLFEFCQIYAGGTIGKPEFGCPLLLSLTCAFSALIDWLCWQMLLED